MDCFICNKFVSISCISKHFKLVHSKTDTYRCTYGKNCCQYISSLNNFIRHFKAHVQADIKSNSNIDKPIITKDTQTISSTSQECSTSRTVSIYNSEDISLSSQDIGVKFALEFHSNVNFNRKNVISIQNNVMDKIVNPIFANIKQFCEQNLSLDIHQNLLLSTLFQNIEKLFKVCETEYKLEDWLKSNDYMARFEEFQINCEIAPLCSKGEIQFDTVEILGVLLPISFQFRKTFEKNNQLLKTLNEMERITNNIEHNAHFIQGSLWQEKNKKFENKIAIPFFLYIDDAEVNNPLGSHCTPISFIYYALPVIDNCEIFKGKDYKELGNEKCLHTLVREIKLLEEEGITIATNEGNKTVYFVLGLVIGDNLGINTILGFVSSFSANFFCRFCKTIKTSTHTDCMLNMNLSRNSENYEEDVLLSDVSLTGVKENSILNSIQSFHVTSNFSVDVCNTRYIRRYLPL